MLADQVGSIEVGKDAGFVIVRRSDDGVDAIFRPAPGVSPQRVEKPATLGS